ncbi:MAG: antibiotic biosynthesis monooxygenase [Flavobacteriales bacterium]
MSEQDKTAPAGNDGATVVITHRVRHGAHTAYEQWLNAIGPVCRSYPGHLDWQIIRPITGLSGTFTVVIRFDTQAHLHAWMNSADRKRFIEQVRPLLVADDDFHIRTGLDFWFTPEGAKAGAPVRWKQVLVTWSAIFPLVLLTPLVVSPVLRWMHVSPSGILATLVNTGIVVVLMSYVVMPSYTRLIKRWLFS